MHSCVFHLPKRHFHASPTSKLAGRVISHDRRLNTHYNAIARLLRLPGLGHLALSALLGGLCASICVENIVPPPEAASVVANELLVVDVVVLGAGPERQKVVQAPGELVAAVGIDGLEKTDDDPDVHGQEVEVLGDGAPHDGYTDSSETQNHDLNGRGILGGETKGSRVLVVDLVDVLVQERAGVHGAVGPVVPRILADEEDGELVCYLVDAGEGDRRLEAKVLAHGVEQPDLGKLDGEVGEEDEESALHLLPSSGDLVLRRISFGCAGDLFRHVPAGSCSG